MRLSFSGRPEITAPRGEVWMRLLDPHFVARSAPGVESVQTVDDTHFKVVSGFGVGFIKLRLALDVELFDLVAPTAAKMRALGIAAGSEVDTTSSLELDESGPDRTRLTWSAVSEVSGALASVGARLMEGAIRALTEQFWTDFARRASRGAAQRR